MSTAGAARILARKAVASRALVTPGRLAWYYPGAANLAAGIRAALANPDQLTAMRARALTFAAERGWDRIFDDLIADYRTGIAEGRPAAACVEPARVVAPT